MLSLSWRPSSSASSALKGVGAVSLDSVDAANCASVVPFAFAANGAAYREGSLFCVIVPGHVALGAFAPELRPPLPRYPVESHVAFAENQFEPRGVLVDRLYAHPIGGLVAQAAFRGVGARCVV